MVKSRMFIALSLGQFSLCILAQKTVLIANWLICLIITRFLLYLMNLRLI